MKKIVETLYFDGLSPQKAIKYLTNLVNRQKQEDKRFLKIESYNETYGHPFSDGTQMYRLIIDKGEN